jgi:hypothetical protein
MDRLIFETPLVVAQHTKTIAGDHDLNPDEDVIVIRLQGACEAA